MKKKEHGYLLVNLLEKILERSPLGSVIVRNVFVLDLRDILTISMEELKKKSILNALINLKQVASCFFRQSFKSIHSFSDGIKSMSRHVY